jgi:N-acetylmuramoyl-L-alanine amidase
MKRTIYLIILIIFFIFFNTVKISTNSKRKDPSAARFSSPNKNTSVIVIDPGHGGIDGGASLNGLVEKDINLDISLKIRDYLEQEGFSVIMTRQLDVSLEGLSNTRGSRYIRDLTARVDKINNSSARMFLSIHVNCYLKNPKVDGSIVFYDKSFKENKILAYCIQRALNNMAIGGKRRTAHDPKIGDYFILRNSRIPGAIVETAFISNRTEWNLLKQDKFRDDIAKNIVKGVKQYLEEIKDN